MRAGKGFLLLACALVLTRCATLGIHSPARNAFEDGLAFFNQGQYEEAISYFQEAIELDPDYPEAYLYLGKAYLNLGRWANAISPLRTAFRLAPDETRKEALNLLVDALFGAGVDQLKTGNYANSIGHLDEALQLKPGYDQARTRLLSALLEYGSKSLGEGNPVGAIDAFSRALELEPGNITAYFSLAKAYFMKGDFSKSLETLRSLLRIDPGNSDAQALLMQLITR